MPETKNVIEKVQHFRALLLAGALAHWTGHHQAKGPTSSQDHLLFKGFYEPMLAEFDTLSEKMVARFGVDVVDLEPALEQALQLVKRFKGADNLKRSLGIEQLVQTAARDVRDALEEEGALSMGMDNFLQGLADAHEGALYHLTQRLS